MVSRNDETSLKRMWSHPTIQGGVKLSFSHLKDPSGTLEERSQNLEKRVETKLLAKSLHYSTAA